ncbi:MAG: membrane dipeptidase [Kiritimatiellae bacterium]|nr:membrane dipeptidase [Kiritimatiellia bacterium]
MDEAIERTRQRTLEYIGATPEQVERGLALHAKLFACDTFGFLPRTLSKKAYETLWAMIENGATFDEIAPVKQVLAASSHLYDPWCRERFLEAIAATGLNCTVLTMGSEKDLHHSLHRISWYIQLFDHMREHLRKALGPPDIETARREKKLAVVCSTNCPPAHGGLHDGVDAHHWIDIFYRLGIRVMHLTYNRRNWVGDGCLEPADGGLSLHGRDVVRHLNEIGMVVDTPHTGRRTTLDAAKHSKAPIMATHTVCRGLYEHPRGKTDDELKAIADTGGLVGMCVIPYFLGEGGNINTLLDHLDYALNLIGPDHVAIGTDTAYSAPLPDGAEPFDERHPQPSPYSREKWWGAWQPEHQQPKPTEEQAETLRWTNWPCFTVGLVARGHNEAEIAKVLGGNFLRVLADVQKRGERPA